MTRFLVPVSILTGATLVAGALYLRPTEFEKCVDLFTEQVVVFKKLKSDSAKFVATEMCVGNGRK